jgi:hypothetical protein
MGISRADLSPSTSASSYVYKLAAAGATTTMANLGTGKTGDYLSHVNIQPTLLALAAFQILDGSVVFYDSTAQTLLDLRAMVIPVGCASQNGAWSITMGTGGKATGVGIF